MHFNERSIFLSIEAALELMISFAAFVAPLIFGILEATKNDKK
ncbi:putative holin-like toxin [Enterococcus faecalis]|nr:MULTISPECIES: putative holin-like toxin [Enterococcus]MDQ8672475.1 putative holin-like toxin [Enterococcus sp. FR128]